MIRYVEFKNVGASFADIQRYAEHKLFEFADSNGFKFKNDSVQTDRGLICYKIRRAGLASSVAYLSFRFEGNGGMMKGDEFSSPSEVYDNARPIP